MIRHWKISFEIVQLILNGIRIDEIYGIVIFYTYQAARDNGQKSSIDMSKMLKYDDTVNTLLAVIVLPVNTYVMIARNNETLDMTANE